MMTDDKITEEFDAYMVKNIPIDIVQKAREFSERYASTEDEAFQKIAYYQAMGFISGIRASERLVAIEVLEEVLDCSERGMTRAFIENKLEKLKEGTK